MVYVNKADMVDDEMLELVELEMRGILTEYGYDGDNTPFVTGSARCALEGENPELGEKTIIKLLEEVDNWIPLPQREEDKPLVFPIEYVHAISGKGTVVTGRIERGVLRKGDTVDIIGYQKKVNTVVKGKGRRTGKIGLYLVITGLEIFHKELEEARAGDQLGALLRSIRREDIKRGQIMVAPGSLQSHKKLQAKVIITYYHYFIIIIIIIRCMSLRRRKEGDILHLYQTTLPACTPELLE